MQDNDEFKTISRPAKLVERENSITIKTFL